MFKLLNLWQQYIEIIYAPESEINMLKNLKDNGMLSGDAEDLNFASKMENENIDAKLATLFMKEDESELEEDVKQATSKDNMAEPYLSVQEGLTTDTAMSGPEGDLEAKREDTQKQKSPLEAAMNL